MLNSTKVLKQTPAEGGREGRAAPMRAETSGCYGPRVHNLLGFGDREAKSSICKAPWGVSEVVALTLKGRSVVCSVSLCFWGIGTCEGLTNWSPPGPGLSQTCHLHKPASPLSPGSTMSLHPAIPYLCRELSLVHLSFHKYLWSADSVPGPVLGSSQTTKEAPTPVSGASHRWWETKSWQTTTQLTQPLQRRRHHGETGVLWV